MRSASDEFVDCSFMDIIDDCNICASLSFSLNCYRVRCGATLFFFQLYCSICVSSEILFSFTRSVLHRALILLGPNEMRGVNPGVHLAGQE